MLCIRTSGHAGELILLHENNYVTLLHNITGSYDLC